MILAQKQEEKRKQRRTHAPLLNLLKIVYTFVCHIFLFIYMGLHVTCVQKSVKSLPELETSLLFILTILST